MMIVRLLTLLFIFVFVANGFAQTSFVSRRGGNFYLSGKQYRFVGTNYWYGSLLGLEKNKKRGI
ncbi:MAG: hypothetical protein ABL959_17160, partial [Pyrinomonadaceae bacterium]